MVHKIRLVLILVLPILLLLMTHIIVVIVVPLKWISLVLRRLLVLSLQVLTERVHVLWEVVVLEGCQAAESINLRQLTSFLGFYMNILVWSYYVNWHMLIVADLIVHWN